MAKEIENEETIESEIYQAVASQKLDEKAKKQKKRRARQKVLKVLLALTIVFLINVYIILAIFYRGENFTITLDSEYGRESSLVIYETPDNKTYRTFLRSGDVEFITDLSLEMVLDELDIEAEGTHHGRGYIAYSFYAENMGQDTINYWATIEIDDVVRDVDEAVRVMVYKNGERTIYAKNSKVTGEPEPDTVPFYDEDTVMLEVTKDFKVGDIDKYTIVIWVDGPDPECDNNLIGGEIKMHMTLTEEHILQEDEKPQDEI